MGKKRIYPRQVEVAVLSEIPPDVLNALSLKGWNVFGIYELVERKMKEHNKWKRMGAIRPIKVK